MPIRERAIFGAVLGQKRSKIELGKSQYNYRSGRPIEEGDQLRVCGIVALFKRKDLARPLSLARAMSDKVAHRGPDGSWPGGPRRRHSDLLD